MFTYGVIFRMEGNIIYFVTVKCKKCDAVEAGLQAYRDMTADYTKEDGILHYDDIELERWDK